MAPLLLAALILIACVYLIGGALMHLRMRRAMRAGNEAPGSAAQPEG